MRLPRGYNYATVEVDDASGANVHYFMIPAGGGICGAPVKPVWITGLKWLEFHLVPGTCEDLVTPSTPTTGTVRVTLGRTAADLD